MWVPLNVKFYEYSSLKGKKQNGRQKDLRCKINLYKINTQIENYEPMSCIQSRSMYYSSTHCTITLVSNN
jgi:hypothetical protein